MNYCSELKKSRENNLGNAHDSSNNRSHNNLPSNLMDKNHKIKLRE